MEGPKVTEEIRRSDGDPTRSEIREYLLVSLDLVSRRAIPEHVEGRYQGRQLRPVTCKSRLGGEEKEGVEDVGRREASLMTLAMSGSAISDRCTVT